MKRVVSESEVAHLWANQLQSDARKQNGSFYFDGRTIYSYGGHFPIAVIDKEDAHTVFFTTRTYSVTTSGHINTVRHASNHKNTIYCKNPDQADRRNHEENIASFEARAKYSAMKLPKSRKPELYLNEIAQQKALLTRYAEYFGLNLAYFPLEFIYIESKDGGTKATEAERLANEKARIEREKRQAEYQAEQLKKHKQNLTKWRKFQKQYDMQAATLYSRFDFDYLRFNSETNRIETTQGVEIPLKTAKTFYTQILAVVKSGKCHVCGQKFMDSYEIKEINNKQVVVGCHTIEIKEIKKLSAKLGW